MFVFVIFLMPMTKLPTRPKLKKAWFVPVYGSTFHHGGEGMEAGGGMLPGHMTEGSPSVQSWTIPAHGIAPPIFSMDLPISPTLDNYS